MGRPSIKTPEVIEEICRRLSEGETYKKICADKHMPAYYTVWEWEQKDEEFAQLSARARDVGTHHLADQCLEIADTAEDVNLARLRVDTRMRLIGKWNAKTYGDKQKHEIGDTNGNPITPVLNVFLAGNKPEPAREAD